MKMEQPTYTTSRAEGVVPIFFTSVVFGGKTYVGNAGRNKRDAEQFGARTVIQWLLGLFSLVVHMNVSWRKMVKYSFRKKLINVSSMICRPVWDMHCYG